MTYLCIEIITFVRYNIIWITEFTEQIIPILLRAGAQRWFRAVSDDAGTHKKGAQI